MKTNEPSILIVDDNKDNILVLGLALKEKDYNLTVAFNGPDALEILESTPVDLVLLDVMMPGMDGFEVCRRIKANEKLREVPVIFITALNDTENIVRGFEAGGIDYLTKPFKKRELFARVETQLKIRRQQRQLEEQARELKQTMMSRDKLYSIIAHDLRSPLANIKSILMALDSDLIEPENFRQLIGMLRNTTNETYDLLENLLLWSRRQSAMMKPDFSEADINEIAEKTLHVLQPVAESKKISLVLDTRNAGRHTVDKNMISTILRNLTSNAIKFTPEGGTITISCSTVKDALQIKVADTGIGMSREDCKKLLNPHEHFTTKGTANEKGAGLGFQLVQEFVSAHNGKLEVDSERGKGTTFTITIPPVKDEKTGDHEQAVAA
ncbi:MAG: hybrid sensor histidine kinase/response regulator [Bacteroidales bacterium]